MDHSISLEPAQKDDLSSRLDAAAPWLVSVVFHLAIGLLVLFLAWFIVKATRAAMHTIPIVMPTAVDPRLPGGILNPGDQNNERDPAQRIKELAFTGIWSHTGDKSDIMQMAPGITGDLPADLIMPGSGGSTGTGNNNGLNSGGPMAPYGTPGGGFGNGKFWNIPTGGAANIVYIIDHSGSLLDNFDYLRAELKRSVRGFSPAQKFAVVAFSEDAEILGPPMLQRASSQVTHELENRVDSIKAQGQNDGQLLPFQHAFEKAFSMKPQLIYFLTDGAFDPKLTEVIRHLNADHAVRINTLAFVHADPEYENQLKALAKENGGIYKFVSEKDLGN